MELAGVAAAGVRIERRHMRRGQRQRQDRARERRMLRIDRVLVLRQVLIAGREMHRLVGRRAEDVMRRADAQHGERADQDDAEPPAPWTNGRSLQSREVKRSSALWLTLILVVTLGRIAMTWRIFSVTYDEPLHVASGYDYLKHHTFVDMQRSY